MIQLFEFHNSRGFQEIDDFIWTQPYNANESDSDILKRLGYDEFDKLIPDEKAHWVEVYSNDEAEFQYLISVSNHFNYRYIACRQFVDYLEFIRKYLPAIEKMNQLSSGS